MDVRDNSGHTALSLAMQDDKYSCVKALVLGGADVEMSEMQSGPLIHYIVQKDDVEGIEELLNNSKIDINKVNEQGYSICHIVFSAFSKNQKK